MWNREKPKANGSSMRIICKGKNPLWDSKLQSSANMEKKGKMVEVQSSRERNEFMVRRNDPKPCCDKILKLNH